METKTLVNPDSNAAEVINGNFLNQSTPIDHREFEHNEFLANLQGNILKGHGRDNTVHMIVSFEKDEKVKALTWIRKFAREKVTSFKEQMRQREIFKRNGVGGGLFAGIYFTSQFYKDFEYNVDRFNDRAFIEGMEAAQGEDRLNDDYTKLEDVYKQAEKPIHAMILLAHEELIELNKAANEICGELEPEDPTNKNPVIAKILTTEYGSAIRNSNGDGLEHFGYVDGISQPLFLQEDMEEYHRRNVGTIRFDPFAPLGLVLVNDPLDKSENAHRHFGSYFVFRKLEQLVRQFKEAERELGKVLFSSPKKEITGKDNEEEDNEEQEEIAEERERVGAMIVGRFEDGTPATLSGEDKMISSGVMNNFHYGENFSGQGEDNKGARCPFHGHIRKTNPRDENARSQRMARRGITYGHRNVSTTVENHFVQMPQGGVGLLFMSFQSSIRNQFEEIQKAANSSSAERGQDLVIGQGEGNRRCSYAKVFDNVDSIVVPDKPFENCVHLKGGEYFFAPSISFLKAIGEETEDPGQPT